MRLLACRITTRRRSCMPATSCSAFLNLPRRDCLSFASWSATAWASSSWSARVSFSLESMLAEFSISCSWRRRSAFSAAIFLFDPSMSLRVRVASSIFLLWSLRVFRRFLWDFSEAALERLTSSTAARASAISRMMRVLSFSTLFFILLSCSICSVISAIASWCFFFRHKGGLLLDVCLLQIAAKLGNLSLTLLVQFNLGRGGARGLSKTLSHVLELASKIGPLPLGLGASLPLCFQFFLQLFNMSLVLLDALLDLSDQALFVIELGKEDTGVLLLALNAGFELLLGPLLVGNRLLGDLQVSFDLPPLLLNVGTATLLLLKRRLELIQSRLQLALDLVQVSHLVLGSTQVLGGLGSILADVLLLLVQLVDHLILVGNLIVEAADGVVAVGLLLLNLCDCHLDILNILLDSCAFLLKQLLVSHGILTRMLLGNESVLGIGQIHLQASNG